MKATDWHRGRAADPATPADELAAVAAAYPELHVEIAANPACPDELLDWLWEHGSPALRQGTTTGPPTIPAPTPIAGSFADLLGRASDPATPAQELADLAAAHPQLQPAIAANPSTYPDLLAWLRQYGDAAVQASLDRRDGRLAPPAAAPAPAPAAAPLWTQPLAETTSAPRLVGMTSIAVPLSVPLYGANLPQSVSRFFRSYATFTGRASRAEYWWVAVTNIVVYGVLGALTLTVGAATGTPTSTGVIMGTGAFVGLVPLGIWFLATIIPGLALTVRRLHDANFGGATILLGLIPWVGSLIVLIFTVLPPNPVGARFDA